MTPLVAATVPDIVTFVICAIVVLSGAIGVITSRHAVHAALSLVLTLFGVAVLFIEQHAYFLAAVQVIVYAGAIVVLFLFVIMFLGVDRTENVRLEPLRGQRALATLFVAVALAGVLALAATSHWVTGAHGVAGATSQGHHSDTFLLGRSVFTTYLWAFEITAALLVIAVVGAVVLARRPSRAHDPFAGPTTARAPAEGGLPAGDGPGPVPAGGPGPEQAPGDGPATPGGGPRAGRHEPSGVGR